MNLAKGCALALHRQGDLIDSGGAIDGAKLLDETSTTQSRERGAVRHGFFDSAGIGVDQGNAVAVGEGGVVDLGVVADDGLEQGCHGLIVLEDGGDGVASLGEIFVIELIAGQLSFQRLAGGVKDLVSDEIGVVVALIDALAKDLGDVEAGKGGNQDEDHSADCEH